MAILFTNYLSLLCIKFECRNESMLCTLNNNFMFIKWLLSQSFRRLLQRFKYDILTADLDLRELNKSHKCNILNWPLISHPVFDLSINRVLGRDSYPPHKNDNMQIMLSSVRGNIPTTNNNI